MDRLRAYRVSRAGPIAGSLLAGTAFLFVCGVDRAGAAVHAGVEAVHPGAPSAPEGAALRPLRAPALRALLAGVRVTPVAPEGVVTSHPPAEIFGTGGHYLRIGNRTRAEGRFVIRGDRLCVQGQGIARSCRRVYPRGNGTYAFVDLANGSATLMRVAANR